MALDRLRLEKLRRVARLHLNWFLASILGEDALTDEERAELEKFNKLPKESLNLAERSALLGRFKAILKTKEWKDFNWEKFLSVEKSPQLTPLEKLTLQQAKLRAASNIKSLTQAIESNLFDELAKHTNQIVTEAALKQIIVDEVSLGLIEKKHYQEVASNLADRTKTAYSPKWELISRTELHTAKTEGLAQAIINKVDIYKHSQGIDSSVSIVPSSGTCGDCANHYLDSSGNPKVFPLRELINAGSNADSDHSKKKGIHVNWKTTLPALHPACRCVLTFIPPGYEWVNGKLSLTSHSKLSKAIGDSKLSATQNSPGPPQETKPVSPPSIPGVKSPTQQTKGGVSGTLGKAEETQPCPFGGGDACKQNGGNGAKTHEQGGSIMKAHMEALARGVKATDPEAAQALKQKTIEDAIHWSKQPNPHQVKLDHLKHGDLVDIYTLGESEGGVTEAHRVTIGGNGRALMKPPQSLPASVLQNQAVTEGAHSVPHGRGAHHEAAAYDTHMMLGLTDHVPPTEIRAHDGKTVSMQSWQEDFVSPMTYFQKTNHENTTAAILSSVPDHKVNEVREKLSEIATMAIVLNHNDQHLDNIMFNPKTHELRAIDNTTTSANGMEGIKCQTHAEMHKLGMKLKVPDKLMERFNKTTLGDFKRSGSKLHDWQVGQNYLRMQYAIHLQKTEGHLDFEKFRTTIGTVDGELLQPRKGFWDSDKMITQFYDRESKGQLSNQLFESFAKAWLDERLGDKSHPDHETAKELDSIGVFMPPGSMANPAQVRAEGKHKEYEKTVKAAWPEKTLPASRATNDNTVSPEDIKTGKATPVSSLNSELRTKKPGRKGLNKSLFISNDIKWG